MEVSGVAQLVPLCQQLCSLCPQRSYHEALSRLDVIPILAISGSKIQTRALEYPGKALGRGRQVWDPTLTHLASLPVPFTRDSSEVPKGPWERSLACPPLPL